MNRKIPAAAVAVAMALTGVFTGLEWLTVAALVLWFAAMLYFGIGDRTSSRHDPEMDEPPST